MKSSLLVLLLLVVECGFCSVVDTKWMKETLLKHFSINRHHVTNPTNKALTKTYIQGQFASYGLETRVHQFNTRLPDVKGYNVIGILKGAKFGTKDDFPFGLGAHYDTMRETPGVDDNGSGVVALLQVAKTLASQKCKRDYSIFFVAFDFEEWECQKCGVPEIDPNTIACDSISCGSKSLVNEWIPNYWKQNYPLAAIQQGLPEFQGAIILDTVMNVNLTSNSQTVNEAIGRAFPDVAANLASRGVKGDFIAAAGRHGNENEQNMIKKFKDNWPSNNPEYHVEVFNLPSIDTSTPPTKSDYETHYLGFARSDNLRFWLGNRPAIFITDTADNRGNMIQCYHKACDKNDQVTDERINFLAKTTYSLIKTMGDMAKTTQPCVTSASEEKHVNMAVIVFTLAIVLFTQIV